MLAPRFSSDLRRDSQLVATGAPSKSNPFYPSGRDALSRLGSKNRLHATATGKSIEIMAKPKEKDQIINEERFL